MQTIEGKKFKVEKIVYYDKKSKWGVLATKAIDKLGPIQNDLTNKYGNISVTGNFEGVFEGADVIISGITVDGRYGLAVQIKTIQVLHDTKTREGIVNFLAKSLIKGISVQNALKIYDTFKSKSIDIVLDEPQKMGGDVTQKALKNFNPLFSLNYSATHKTQHNLVYVLDALDAFNKRLVKKIEVKGFEVKNFRGTDKYLYLEQIVLS